MTDFTKQEKQLEELEKKFAELNSLFDEIMQKNNFTEEDLNIDESTLPEEVQKAWQKIKSDIENNAKAHANVSAPSTASKAGHGRRNVIRL